jgi:hypothetical protein
MTIYLVYAQETYESSEVVNIYTDEVKAEARVNELYNKGTNDMHYWYEERVTE